VGIEGVSGWRSGDRSLRLTVRAARWRSRLFVAQWRRW
jgi:hypothetical protein